MTTEDIVKKINTYDNKKTKKGLTYEKKKERLDILLVEQGLIETREKAKRAVMAGIVYCNEERLDKPGEKVTV